MKFAIAKKIKMTQIFDQEGRVHPVTAVSLQNMTVTMLRNKDRDGYSAVQVGYGSKNPNKVTKPIRGLTKDKSFEGIKEFQTDSVDGYKIGEDIDTATVFLRGDLVSVSANSKGKGFQGVVKRHNFHGGPRTHGQKHTERSPGSISGGLRCRVPKGMKMAGRMGGNKVTVKGLQIMEVDKGSGIILLKGSLPGRRGTIMEIMTI